MTGEIAQDIIEGEICDTCCRPFKHPQGYQATCGECQSGGPALIHSYDEEAD